MSGFAPGTLAGAARCPRSPVAAGKSFAPNLGFCSLHSHCDSVFQQSDQLCGTVSAGCHRKTVLQVFPCGCKFSNLWVQVFQLALAFDKMKSCRHKRHRHLILKRFRAGGSDLIGRRRGIQRQGETDPQKSPWLENAARHRNRDVSPDGAHPTRGEATSARISSVPAPATTHSCLFWTRHSAHTCGGSSIRIQSLGAIPNRWIAYPPRSIRISSVRLVQRKPCSKRIRHATALFQHRSYGSTFWPPAANDR